ncbi:MAG: metallophosphoesterase [Halobacteriota archaeon]|nr:metallophosphoesterase [Halobacteriota archaeon]
MMEKRLLQRRGVEWLVAVSDIHGWYRPLVELLEKVGIIKKLEAEGDGAFKVGEDHFRYIGGGVTIVIVGDFVDVDIEGKKVIDLMVNLELEALKVGGELIALSGNHERDLLKLESRYWGLIDEYRGWIEKRPVVAIVNNVLFVHGGINRRVLGVIQEKQRVGEDFISAFARILEEDEDVCVDVTNKAVILRDDETFNDIMEYTGVDYMVVGHAATNGKRRAEIKLIGPNIAGRPRFFNIDTDMGDWFQGYKDQKKRNGGLLSLRWTKEGLKTEYFYRN